MPANSKKSADIVQPKLSAAMGLNNRGVKAANFQVVRETNMPAILTEGGYMNYLLILRSYVMTVC